MEFETRPQVFQILIRLSQFHHMILMPKARSARSTYWYLESPVGPFAH